MNTIGLTSIGLGEIALHSLNAGTIGADSDSNTGRCYLCADGTAYRCVNGLYVLA